MSETITTTADELRRLQERAGKLAQDKAHLQLIVSLMNKVGTALGLENMIESLLTNIIEALGGANIVLYYTIDDELYYADLLGKRQKIERIDDELVRRAYTSGEPVEQEHAFCDTQMLTPAFTKAYSWAFPLLAGSERIGAIKLESLHIAMGDLYGTLPTFFNYVASSLKNEIHSHTRLERAYGALRERNFWLRESQRISRLGSYELDLAVGRWQCSETLCELFGIDDAYEKTIDGWTRLIHPDHRERMRDYFAGCVLEAGQEFDNDYLIVRASDGQERWVHGRGSLVFDGGRPVRMFGTIQDITERKLTEEKLQRAMAEADEANRAKSVFLANMSHELRTPLNAILGFTQLMTRDASLSEAARKHLAIVNRSGEHLLAMISDVLDLSKIEAGKVELREEPFDLVSTLEDVGEMIRSRATPKGLSIRVELDPDLPRHVRADLGKMRQVMINLLGNAVKFTQAGGVVLRARTSPLAGDPLRRLLEMEVEDTGPGIAQGGRDAIFEPFVQTGSFVARQQGTGLGLTISRSFVLLMGGELELESREGEGSLFRVRLPVQIAERGVPPAAEVPSLTVVGLEPTEVSWRVLVVEDNPENLQLLETLLTRVGFHVRTAGNGQEGVAVAQSFRPHFIWMDMKMPVMDGYEATRRIRSFPWGREIGIYALTASVFSEQEETILAAGCDGVFHKPYREREIYQAMARHLGLRYRYAGKTDGEPAGSGEGGAVQQPSNAELAALPPEIARRIRTAARELNKREIAAIASGLAATSPTLVAFLQVKTTSYDFDAIERLMTSLHGEGI